MLHFRLLISLSCWALGACFALRLELYTVQPAQPLFHRARHGLSNVWCSGPEAITDAAGGAGACPSVKNAVQNKAHSPVNDVDMSQHPNPKIPQNSYTRMI